MMDDSDQTDADRTHEGYERRYEKERRASYGVVIFGLLALVVVVISAFLHHTGFGTTNYTNIEPSAGDNTVMAPAPADANTTDTNTMDTNTTGTNTVTNTTNTTQ